MELIFCKRYFFNQFSIALNEIFNILNFFKTILNKEGIMKMRKEIINSQWKIILGKTKR